MDGKLMVDLWDWTEQGEAMFDNSEDILFEIQMEAGKSVELVAETTNEIWPISKQRLVNCTHASGVVESATRRKTR